MRRTRWSLFIVLSFSVFRILKNQYNELWSFKIKFLNYEQFSMHRLSVQLQLSTFVRAVLKKSSLGCLDRCQTWETSISDKRSFKEKQSIRIWWINIHVTRPDWISIARSYIIMHKIACWQQACLNNEIKSKKNEIQEGIWISLHSQARNRIAIEGNRVVIINVDNKIFFVNGSELHTIWKLS